MEGYVLISDTASTEIYTLSLHDALPISQSAWAGARTRCSRRRTRADGRVRLREHRSEEHTSELQSRRDLVCRLLLEKKIDSTSNDSLGGSIFLVDELQQRCHYCGSRLEF